MPAVQARSGRFAGFLMWFSWYLEVFLRFRQVPELPEVPGGAEAGVGAAARVLQGGFGAWRGCRRPVSRLSGLDVMGFP